MNRRTLLSLTVAASVLGAAAAVGILVPLSRKQLLRQVENAVTPVAYPRLWNNGSRIGSTDAAMMARWDVWGMAGNLATNPNGTPNIATAKAAYQLLYNQNPNLKILVYADAIVASNYQEFTGLTVPSSWGLVDSHGAPVIYGAGQLMNVSAFCPVVNGQKWTDALAAACNSVFWQQGCGNGFQFDDVDLQRILSYADIDLDRNGVNDYVEHGSAWVLAQWQTGIQNLVAQCRALMGSSAIIVGNGDIDTRTWANGRNNEGWNAPANVQNGTWNGAWPQWAAAFSDYRTWNATHYGDFYGYVTHPEHNVSLTDYTSLRFYLTTCLMGDGLFAWYTAWDQYNWIDEYSVNLSTGQATGDGTGKGYLGLPLGPYQVLGNGVYRRDFTNGIALCNPTGLAQTVILETTYQRIHGTQDSGVNNGQTVSQVSISAGNTRAGYVGDGLILLRRAVLSPVPTSVPLATSTASVTVTNTMMPTAIDTATLTATALVTLTDTSTPTPTPTPTIVATSTATRTPTATPTPKRRGPRWRQ